MRYLETQKNKEGQISIENQIKVIDGSWMSFNLFNISVEPGIWNVFSHRIKEEVYCHESGGMKIKDTVKFIHLSHENIVESDKESFFELHELKINGVSRSLLQNPLIVGEFDSEKLMNSYDYSKSIPKDYIYSPDFIKIVNNRINFHFEKIPKVYVVRNSDQKIIEILIETATAYADAIFEIGDFNIETGEVVVSDPCYEIGTWCQGTLQNVKKGKWYASVKKTNNWGYRCAELIAVASQDIKPEDIIEKTEIHVGVDSGQAGIFDKSVYKNNDSVLVETFFDENDKWYSVCCDITLGEIGAGVINGGVVSSSGFGDGDYNCYVHRNQENIIDGIKIVFIGDLED